MQFYWLSLKCLFKANKDFCNQLFESMDEMPIRYFSVVIHLTETKYTLKTLIIQLNQGLLAGCFGFNDSLRKYFGLYRTISKERGRKKERNMIMDRRHFQTVPIAPSSGRVNPCSYQNQQDAPVLLVTQHHRPTANIPRAILSRGLAALKQQRLVGITCIFVVVFTVVSRAT